MKRNCDQMDVTDSGTTKDQQDLNLQAAKRLRDDTSSLLARDSFEMDSSEDPDVSEEMLHQVLKKFVGSGEHSLVEREPKPGGYSLVNSDYVGKKTYQEVMELEADTSNASQFVLGNMSNKVDQIGRQMKFLHQSLQKALRDSLRDSELHKAACNFVKKPGQTYHLYERSSGQKYFSMLSPNDWSGNPPHTFLGSWYLESDQSWTRAEERATTRFEGVGFIRQLVANKVY